MKLSRPSVLVLAGAFFCAASLIGQEPRSGAPLAPVPWEDMTGFLPEALGGFRAASAVEGGLWDEEGMSLSWVSRKYGPGHSGDGLEVTILDTGGTGVALSEFRRLRLDGERSRARTVTSAKVRGFPAVRARYHQEDKAEVLVLVADRFLAHVIALDLGGRGGWNAAKAAALELDLKGLDDLQRTARPR